ncbi:unnamed protein product [Cuscuta europaea]|uniref:Basic blue protein n=1 Tax=Cuscuta europaea TaxID=41803 RepID=A0A9P0ZMX4_CUSEU|nr:unnamed protein product [Cuscuta europaea]
MSSHKMFVVLAVAEVLLLCALANAHTIPVGDSAGWTYDMGGWPNGKTFKAGDILVFKYDPAEHTVVIVSKENYDSCKPVGKTLSSGHDHVRLTSGTSYYICGIADHCDFGQKINVTAV